jgi:hypothetical protein
MAAPTPGSWSKLRFLCCGCCQPPDCCCRGCFGADTAGSCCCCCGGCLGGGGCCCCCCCSLGIWAGPAAASRPVGPPAAAGTKSSSPSDESSRSCTLESRSWVGSEECCSAAARRLLPGPGAGAAPAGASTDPGTEATAGAPILEGSESLSQSLSQSPTSRATAVAWGRPAPADTGRQAGESLIHMFLSSCTVFAEARRCE